MAESCTLCGDTGLRAFESADGDRVMRDCQCRIQKRADRLLAGTRIPARYQHCALDNFETSFPGASHSIKAGHFQATEFVRRYPVDTGGSGLLFTGSIGVGKTHLAAGVLRKLVTERGAVGMFCDYRDLLKQVQNTYNRNVQATELAVLAPLFDAEVLVLDELGAAKPTEWVWETVGHILNTRYNDRKTTIITTNYPNSAPSGNAYAETLGDRIGERMRSRLQEMCVHLAMDGKDFRQTVAQARFRNE